MKTFKWFLMTGIVCIVAAEHVASAPGAATLYADFAEGQWDTAQWTPMRLVNMTEPVAFRQEADAIAVGPFAAEDIKAGVDNALLVTDLGAGKQAEVSVTFTIGEERGAAPGVIIAPVVKDDVILSGTAVFVASRRLAVWDVSRYAEAGKVTYTHLAQMPRWSDPKEKHTLTVRFARNGNVAVRLDDSDVIVLRKRAVPNMKVGLWGCHGTCRFYSVSKSVRGTLPWVAPVPEVQKDRE